MSPTPEDITSQLYALLLQARNRQPISQLEVAAFVDNFTAMLFYAVIHAENPPMPVVRKARKRK